MLSSSAAVIGFGSAVIGGVVAGGFALLAGRQQGRRDTRRARLDRSHQAAQRLLAALVLVEGTVSEWRDRPNVEQLLSAINAFSVTVSSETAMLTDDDVAARTRAHLELAYWIALGAARTPGSSPPLVVLSETLRRHADVLSASLEAHIRSRPLPNYVDLPMANVAALIAWTPE